MLVSGRAIAGRRRAGSVAVPLLGIRERIHRGNELETIARDEVISMVTRALRIRSYLRKRQQIVVYVERLLTSPRARRSARQRQKRRK